MNKITRDSQDHLKKAQLYLDKIPILKQIHEIKIAENKNQFPSGSEVENRLALTAELLLKDDLVYNVSFLKTSFKYYNNGENDQWFFAFYNRAKQWLRSKFQDNQSYDDKLKGLKLDKPYKLAIELFKVYIDFRKNATQGAQFQNGVDDSKGKYKPNIYDLFTEDDLINLGGNEFIKDCYTAIGHEELLDQHKLDNKPCIQNINSRTGKQLQENNPVKPDLFKRVDNHLSWKIFKDGNIKKLNKDEESVLQDAMKNEGFWKHLGKSELKILPLTGSAALILGLVAGFVFPASFATIVFLVASPLVAGALFIAPIEALISRKSAIVNNMIKISDQNKEFNDKLTKGEDEYKKYKKENPNFLTSELAQEKNIIENKIIPKENNKDNNPFKKIEDPNSNNLKKENKEPS